MLSGFELYPRWVPLINFLLYTNLDFNYEFAEPIIKFVLVSDIQNLWIDYRERRQWGKFPYLSLTYRSRGLTLESKSRLLSLLFFQLYFSLIAKYVT